MSRVVILVTVLLLSAGCAGVYRENWPAGEYAGFVDSNAPRSPKYVFVLFDGTRNDKMTETNVARVAQMLRYEERPDNRVLYVSGVGATDKPFSGSALGYGMEERILLGYAYVTRNYEPGDKLIIMGFSRGAHQARALAGLLSYSGVPGFPDGLGEDVDLMALGKVVIDYTKQRADKDYKHDWEVWTHTDPQPMLDRCKGEKRDCVSRKLEKYGALAMRPVQVDFLGIWDTVPGSSFKKFEDCKESDNDGKQGDRYKSASYPPIRRISHAVSIDEKRSKFAPLLICAPMNADYTDARQVWFPGAHADVGGGYSDSRLLSGVSLNWMIKELAKTYPPAADYPRVPESATALAHWSIGEKPANFKSECKKRKIPQSDEIHRSFYERKSKEVVPIRANFHSEALESAPDVTAYHNLPYPICCPKTEETQSGNVPPSGASCTIERSSD